MNASLLLITHPGVGEALQRNARDILGSCPMPLATLAPQAGESVSATRSRAEALLAELDRGAGVLILTDAYGATPSNLAVALATAHDHPVVAGVNLPMVLRVMNYAHLPLETLAEKALSSARDGILMARAPAAAAGGGGE